MRINIPLYSLFLLACTEAPRMQPGQPVPDGPDLAAPAGADLAGVTNPGVDLALPALAITSITPRTVSTVGRDRVTINGTGFDAKTEVFFGATRADIESMTDTRIVVFSPAYLPWGVPTVVSIRRGADGARAQNTSANNSPTAFSFYASTMSFTQASGRLNPNNYSSPRYAPVADFNNDGKPDVGVMAISNGAVTPMLNNGFGTFATPGGYSMNAGVYKAFPVDLDNDGRPDLLYADESVTWGYVMNNGAGLFNNGVNSYNQACSGVTSPVPIKLSNANFPDIALACFNNNTVRIWTTQFPNNNNRGAMYGTQNAGTVTQLNVMATPFHLVVTDINRDTYNDLVVLGGGNGAATINWYNAPGNPPTALPANPSGTVSTNAANQAPYWMTCKDVNSPPDGYPDCVVSDQNTATLRVFMNNAGVLQPPAAGAAGTIAVGSTPHQVSLFDLNGDGILDIVYGSRVNANFEVIPGKGDGTFGTQTAADGRVLAGRGSTGVSNCRLTTEAEVADFDGDGLLDVLASCEQDAIGNGAGGGFFIFKNTSR